MNRLRPVSLLRRVALLAGLWACCVGTGCGAGGQTGGESPAPGLGCNHQYEVIALDTPTPLGATAASVLAPLLGTHRAPLLWHADTGSVSVGPEQGLSQIELTTAYAGGRIAWAFVPPSDAGSATGAGSSIGFGCPLDQLEIDIEVQLRTGQGALDERFVVTLGAISADNAQLWTRLPIESLQGSLYVTAPEGVDSPALQVSAIWDALGFRGTLLGEVTMESRDPNVAGSGSVSSGFVPYAEWPPPAKTGKP